MTKRLQKKEQKSMAYLQERKFCGHGHFVIFILTEAENYITRRCRGGHAFFLFLVFVIGYLKWTARLPAQRNTFGEKSAENHWAITNRKTQPYISHRSVIMVIDSHEMYCISECRLQHALHFGSERLHRKQAFC